MRLLGLVCATLLGGCTLFTPVDASPEGPVDSGGVDATVPEAGEDAANADANANDGAGRVDAAPDAPPPLPCVGAEHWLCDDFDRDGGLLNRWKGIDLFGDAGVAIEPDPAARSEPNVLRAIASDTAAARAQVQAETTGGNGLHCEFDLRVDERGSAEALGVVVELDGPTGSYVLDFSFSSASPDATREYGTLADGGPIPIALTQFGPLSPDWHHFSVDLGTGASAHLTVALDGVTLVSAPHADLGAFTGGTRRLFAAGVYALGPSSRWRLAFDDVRCDAVP
jgi:hypothetical protein